MTTGFLVLYIFMPIKAAILLRGFQKKYIYRYMYIYIQGGPTTKNTLKLKILTKITFLVIKSIHLVNIIFKALSTIVPKLLKTFPCLHRSIKYLQEDAFSKTCIFHLFCTTSLETKGLKIII